MKKILIFLVTVIGLLTCVLCRGMQPVYAATTYPVWVGGVQVTSDNMNDVFGDGTVSYTPKTAASNAVLELNNANLSGYHTDALYNYSGVIYAIEDLDVSYRGINTLSNNGGTGGIWDYTVCTEGEYKLALIGEKEASLEIEGAPYISGTGLTANGCIWAEEVELSGGKVVLKGQTTRGSWYPSGALCALDLSVDNVELVLGGTGSKGINAVTMQVGNSDLDIDYYDTAILGTDCTIKDSEVSIENVCINGFSVTNLEIIDSDVEILTKDDDMEAYRIEGIYAEDIQISDNSNVNIRVTSEVASIYAIRMAGGQCVVEDSNLNVYVNKVRLQAQGFINGTLIPKSSVIEILLPDCDKSMIEAEYIAAISIWENNVGKVDLSQYGSVKPAMVCSEKSETKELVEYKEGEIYHYLKIYPTSSVEVNIQRDDLLYFDDSLTYELRGVTETGAEVVKKTNAEKWKGNCYTFSDIQNGTYTIWDTTAIAEGIAVGEEISMNGEELFVTIDYYTVKFRDGMMEYGETTKQCGQTVLNGQCAIKPDNPEKEGYEFQGWTTDADNKAFFDFDTPIQGKTILYAAFEKIPEPEVQEEPAIAKGTTFVSGKYIYQVLSVDDSVGTVAVKGFAKGKSAKKVTIPKSVTYQGITLKVTAIANKAFYKNKKINVIVIGNNVKKIGNFAFYKCKKVKKITIGKAVTTIGKHALCIHSKRKITVKFKGKKLKTVKSYNFHGMPNKKVILPKGKKKAYKRLLKL